MKIDPGTAYLASTGANILAGAFQSGTGGNKKNQRDYIQTQQLHGEPYRRENALWGLENIYGNQIQTKVRDAKKAGLHPLFAMGSSGYAPPASSSSSPMPGQSRSGSFAGDGLQALAAGFANLANLNAQRDLVDAQNQASKFEILKQQTSNDTMDLALRQGVTNPALQELEKGKVAAHNLKNREQNLNVLSPMTQFRIGSQNVWLPIEEMDQLMEDPLAVFVAAKSYHGNKGVNWAQLVNEYMGRKPTSKQSTTGTNQMFKRLGLTRRSRTRGELEPGRTRRPGAQPYRPKTWR